MTAIGIRELRQNASRYIRRVEDGETFTVTDRGRPVAQLGPLPKRSRIEQLIAEGKIRPAKGEHDLLDFKPVPPTPGVPLPSEELQRMRDEERW